MDADGKSPPHVVILPSPGLGHLIPLTEFAKRLVSDGFSFTFAVPIDGPPSKAQRSFLSAASVSTASAVDAVFLRPADLSDVPPSVRAETRISLMVARSLPSLRESLSELMAKRRVVVLLVDLFGTDALDVAREFHLSPYIFYPSTAMTLSFVTSCLEKLDETMSCEFRELAAPVEIPGCVPVHGRDLMDPVQDRKDDAYKWVLHHVKRYKLADGIIMNSCEALEGGAIKALVELEPGKPPVYPMGPLVQTGSADGDGESLGILKWLDEQPSGSVLFVNFGSGGALTCEQQNELALGLEISKQRFLWVVRHPNDSATNANFFSVGEQRHPSAFLPEGFLERTRGRSLVVPSWAPQMRILSHGATGGFLSHCGWNSTLESVVNGVPLISWPLYAEQKMNAVMLAEDLKVALRPVAGEDGMVRRGEVARVAKTLMEGEEGTRMRCRMKELKDAVSVVLSEQGSSTRALNQIALKWKSL